MTTMAFPEDLWTELSQTLEAQNETAAILIARLALTDDGPVLLVRQIRWVPDDAYLDRRPDGLEIASNGYVPPLKQAADDGGIAIFYHSHPRSAPTPSHWDTQVDEKLRAAFQLRTGQPIYASLILGGSSATPTFSANLWLDEDQSSIERIRIVGERVTVLSSAEDSVDAEMHDRQILALGAPGQALLRRLHIGVVGSGGTGSAVVEQLVRMGVGTLTVVDDDVLTRSNLSRIHESDSSQIGMSKVAIVERFAARVGGNTQIRAIQARITDETAARSLTACDVVFGCTDDNRGRAILSRLAYWYLIPVLDMGFVVDVAEGSVRGLFGRVTVITPGSACLFCRNRINPGQLAAESLPPDERTRLQAEGYVPGLPTSDPSIGTYTTMTASFAVAELLDRLFGFSSAPRSSEILLRVGDRAISQNTVPPREGHYCSSRSHWGLGDCTPFLDQTWV